MWKYILKKELHAFNNNTICIHGILCKIKIEVIIKIIRKH